MSDFANELTLRTKRFGLRVLRTVQSLPSDRASRVIGDQLMRCGMPVGANYRAARRARSAAEFRAKLGIVEEECDEASYWLEMLIDANIVAESKLSDLITEANEILSVIVTSITTSKKNK